MMMMMILRKKKEKKRYKLSHYLMIRESLRICILISNSWQVVQDEGLSSTSRELVS